MSGATEESPRKQAFQTMLANTAGERRDLTRAVMFWDSLPRFSFEYLNNGDEYLAPETKTVNLMGDRVQVTIRPGHFQLGDETVSRFPGTVELHVELALVKLATEKHHLREFSKGNNGEVFYDLVFNMRDLRRKLSEIGYNYNHVIVKRALFTLATTGINISTRVNKRESVIFMNYVDELRTISDEDSSVYSTADGNFYIRFNRFLSKAIDSAQYRQINLKDLRNKKSFMIYLLQQMQLQGTNLSKQHPFRMKLTDLREATSGLRHSKIRQAASLFEKELERIRGENIISDWERTDILDNGTGKAGRKPLIDLEYSLLPSDRFISQIKAANRNQSDSEQTLGLTPRTRSERQYQLAFGSWPQ